MTLPMKGVTHCMTMRSVFSKYLFALFPFILSMSIMQIE